MFDSGVGGLSILQAIAHAEPGRRLAYCSDDAAYPYGPKDSATVIERVLTVAPQFIAKAELGGLVIACNTASTVALAELRQQVQIPVVGVVPAIKPAATIASGEPIALVATPGTVARPYTDQLIADFAGSSAVVKIGSSCLVDVAEAKLRGQPVAIDVIRAELSALIHKKISVAVLGCTHFPLLLEELTQAVPYPVQWVDSGSAIADRVGQVLPLTEQEAAAVKADVPYFSTAVAKALAATPLSGLDMTLTSPQSLT